jgi:hypothetical protein
MLLSFPSSPPPPYPLAYMKSPDSSWGLSQPGTVAVRDMPAPSEKARRDATHPHSPCLLLSQPPAPPTDFCLVRFTRPSTRYHTSSAHIHTHTSYSYLQSPSSTGCASKTAREDGELVVRIISSSSFANLETRQGNKGPKTS